MSKTLAEAAPLLSLEWHTTKNGDLTPNDVLSGSEKKVWWICSQGHEWMANISARSKLNGTGCPYCSGRNLLENVNDLRTWCLQNNKQILLREWDYEKNGELTPSKITKSNSRKVWWKCEKYGHEWQASIYRSKRLNGKTPYHIYSALFAYEFTTWMANLIATHNPQKEVRIGVIAAYKAQADMIDRLVATQKFPSWLSIQTGTIHGFQGDE